MATRNEIRITNVPDDVFEDIRTSSIDNERTIQAEALYRLKQFKRSTPKSRKK